jgi:demethylmenaquinone methyltransferase/2-methoxy-6-polyprenyl-1,4-benzoquinol methylase
VPRQIAYYPARAPEYDDWWERRYEYDFGPEFEARWAGEVAEVHAALAAFGPTGDVLELAAGTGIFTGRLVPMEHSKDRLRKPGRRTGRAR